MSPVVLASASPRRRQLLAWAGVEIAAVRPADLDETPRPDEDPVAYARRLAEEKARAIDGDGPIVAADTVVHVGAQILGKPEHDDAARAMLSALSGRWHHVTTGVCVRRAADVDAFTVSTRVRFRALADEEIAAYVATGEPADKAGAYAIQGRGGALIAEVHGSWTNVMGLPVEEVLAALAEPT